MFGKSKRQIKNVTFVQPLKGEVYFYTPIAYATSLQDSNEKESKQVFNDSDLALAGKLKLIFEREKMTWFEIKEEKSTTPSKIERWFALYYYPHRLVAGRAFPFEEKATLQDIDKLFDFIVTKDQTRLAEIQQSQSPTAYDSVAEQQSQLPTADGSVAEPQSLSTYVSVTGESGEEPQETATVELAKRQPIAKV